MDSETATKVIKAREAVLRALVERSEQQAEQQIPTLLAEARRHAQDTLQREVDRLKALQQVNPNVRDEEIAFFSDQLDAVNAALASVRLRLDAVRVIVTT